MFVRRHVRHALLTRGHAVVEVGNGARAIDVLAEHEAAFDVVITDIAMPGADGVEVLWAARRHAPRAVVIALTGIADDRVRDAGFDVVMEKPANLDVLGRVIEESRGHDAEEDG
jgi:CheY-like chemotaxis protein